MAGSGRPRPRRAAAIVADARQQVVPGQLGRLDEGRADQGVLGVVGQLLLGSVGADQQERSLPLGGGDPEILPDDVAAARDALVAR